MVNGACRAIQSGCGDQQAVDMPAVELGRDQADKTINSPFQQDHIVDKANEPTLCQRREFGDSPETRLSLSAG